MHERGLPRATLAALALAAMALGPDRLDWGSPLTPQGGGARFESPARSPTALDLARPCAPCHPTQASAWARSQHANACRAFDPRRDPAPPDRALRPAAILGVAPLVQLLVPAPGGRLQVFDPALDTRTLEWFSIFGAAPPGPDAWGHWTQRGMSWNAQCAACHMTDLRKGYDPASDTYRTTWAALGIACAQCHGDMTSHARAPRPDPAHGADLRERAAERCGVCHARREDLTGEHRPGDPFDDHFRLLLADAPDLHHPDGQAADEVFELTGLLGSRMGRAGVTCLDCHEPHSGGLRAPVDDDTLCLACHAPPGQRGATPIVREEHVLHAPGSAGARCVGCHMPEKVYMARDVRRDHAFTSPDPELSREVGAPDACRGCHEDQPAEWAVAWVDAWYGAAMDRPARRRARAVHRARTGDRSVAPELAALARGDDNPIWRAALVGMLGPFAEEPAAGAALAEALDDPNAGVRAAAVRALARIPTTRSRLLALRRDPVRLVRLAALWATRTTPVDDEATRREVQRWLDVNADQPAGALRRSEHAIVERRPEDAVAWARRAVAWDPSGPSYHTLARALAAAGRRDEARQALARAEALLRPPATGAPASGR